MSAVLSSHSELIKLNGETMCAGNYRCIGTVMSRA
jgi:hypothetical protein